MSLTFLQAASTRRYDADDSCAAADATLKTLVEAFGFSSEKASQAVESIGDKSDVNLAVAWLLDHGEEDRGGAVRFVQCPHLREWAGGSSYAVPLVGPSQLSFGSPCSAGCSSSENWVCLNCSETNCSRYVNSHAVAHHAATGHPTALSLSDLSVWCYLCEAYVTDERLKPLLARMSELKFGGSSSSSCQPCAGSSSNAPPLASVTEEDEQQEEAAVAAAEEEADEAALLNELNQLDLSDATAKAAASVSFAAATSTTELPSQALKPLRLSFTLNAGPKKGVPQSTALVAPALSLVLSAATNKLRLKKKDASRARLFVWGTGDELLESTCAAMLKNDDLVAVSLGEPYAGPIRKASNAPEPTAAAVANASTAAADVTDAFAVFDVGDDGAARASASSFTSAIGSASAPPAPPAPSAPPRPPPAPHRDLDRFAQLLRDASPESVIVLVGAGASVSAGIPDFRTPGTGLYDNLQKYNLPYAEAVFDIKYFRKHPTPFYTLCKEMWPGAFDATPAHHFFKALNDHGKLLRCFSQNIDSLESVAGLPSERIVAAHGNFDAAHVVPLGERPDADGGICPEARAKVDVSEVKAAVMAGEEGWRRMNAKHRGLVKPAITFFGENLPKRFVECVESDFQRCELVLIFGTSLMVQPFASLVKFAPRGTPRLLVNRERRGEDLGLDFDAPGSPDGLYLGDCDAGALGLADRLGWRLPGS